MARRRDKQNWADGPRLLTISANVGLNNATPSMVLSAGHGVWQPADTVTAGQCLAAKASRVGFGTSCPAAELHIG